MKKTHFPPAPLLGMAIALILIPSLLLTGSKELIHYEGTKWMDEREALDLVLEYSDKNDNEFVIVGEGNSVELKYDFKTTDDLEDFDINTHKDLEDIVFWRYIMPILLGFGILLLLCCICGNGGV